MGSASQKSVRDALLTLAATLPDTRNSSARKAMSIQYDKATWAQPNKVAAAPTERDVDLTDWHAVDNAIHQLNAEQLAHQLLP